MAILKHALVTLLLAAAPVGAEITGADFLKLQYGVREFGQSGAGTGAPGSPGFVSLNPAGLASCPQRFIHANRILEFGDTKRYFVQATYDFAAVSLGLGAFYRSLESGDAADELGNVNEFATVGEGNFLPSVTIAKKLAKARVGVTTKLFRTKLAHSSSVGGAVDFGLQHALLDNRGMVGLAVLNAGRARPFMSYRYKLPVMLRAGASFRHQTGPLSLLAAADGVYTYYEGKHWFPVALELVWKKTAFVRVGYPALQEPSPFTLGAGLRYHAFQVDYTYKVAVDDLTSGYGIGLSVWNY